MGGVLAALGWMLLGAVLGAIVLLATQHWRRRSFLAGATPAAELVRAHFHPTAIGDVTISDRRFPYRVRADLQRAVDRLFGPDANVVHFCGVRNEYSHEGVSLSGCLVPSDHNPTISVPPEYEDVDVGEEQPVRCLRSGLWLLGSREVRHAVLLTPAGHYGQITGVRVEVAAPNTPDGTRIAREFFARLEEAVLKSESYRGKILSLEESPHSYTGESSGIRVHRLGTVEREQVILPRRTLDLLDRNVIQFARQRSDLARFRQSTKKGLLFYGPPGTGKTHTIHYLARALAGHTTLLVTAEQIGLLGEYTTLARLLQPSMVVIEDVDLIARERTSLHGPCEEVMLNKLLNEMDGLVEAADVLFVLTTNRPETLEAALASRPGRIDQAIEFPLPDAEGRDKLVRLYSQGIEVPQDLVAEIVRRTDRVSASFLKELMRRSVQFHLERNGTGTIALPDVDAALDEMLFSGGSLNLKLLGAEAAECNLQRGNMD